MSLEMNHVPEIIPEVPEMKEASEEVAKNANAATEVAQTFFTPPTPAVEKSEKTIPFVTFAELEAKTLEKERLEKIPPSDFLQTLGKVVVRNWSDSHRVSTFVYNDMRADWLRDPEVAKVLELAGWEWTYDVVTNTYTFLKAGTRKQAIAVKGEAAKARKGSKPPLPKPMWEKVPGARPTLTSSKKRGKKKEK